MLATPTRPDSIDARARLAPGSGRLAVERLRGVSAAVGSAASSPLSLIVSRPRGAAVWAYASSFGGGLLAGDRTALEVSVGPGATCLLATQAPTKVYRSPDGRAARQRLDVRVGDGGLFALWPDAVCAFAGARHEQRQRFALDLGASLLAVDAVSAGRVAQGERWGFAAHESRTEILVAGELVYLDALRLDAADGSVAARMGRFGACATAVIAGPRLEALAARALAEIGAAPVRHGAPVVAAASPLGGARRRGAVVRAAAASQAALDAFLRDLLAGVAGELGERPWDRRP